MYEIYGYISEETDQELIDSAETFVEATYLVKEYYLAFGNEWTFTILGGE